jgi:glycosyltransferase involved in cell wall biosynthesis
MDGGTRIGMITGEYPPDQGGVGDFTRQLAHALSDLGSHVHVIAGRPRDTQHPTRSQSQPSHLRSQPPGVTVHRTVRPWGWGCWTDVLKLAQDLKLEILNVQYQAAAYGMHPAINVVPPDRGRPPVVVTFHDLKVPYLFPKAGPLRQWAVWMLARRADGVIVTNREDELRLSNLRPPVSNMTRIPIGSNIAPSPPPGYRRDAERARRGIGPDDLLLGYFGFINESKGTEDLIEALGLLVRQGLSAHLLMIGGRVGSSDPTNLAYAQRVERLIADLGLSEHVHWTGYARSEQVSAALLATDLCVLPYRDGISFRRGTLLACLVHGRAIVTTRPAVPLPEAQDGRTMLLVEPQRPPDLAQAVRRLAADPQLRIRLEKEARNLAAEFTWERIARRTAAFFASLRQLHNHRPQMSERLPIE